VQTVTAAEREVLIRCTRAFDLSPPETTTTSTSRDGRDDSPGNDYNRRGPDWAEILKPAGWVEAGKAGDKRLWRRPGKSAGWSAATGVCRSKVNGWDLLYIFSSSAAPFEVIDWPLSAGLFPAANDDWPFVGGLLMVGGLQWFVIGSLLQLLVNAARSRDDGSSADGTE
jgi:hypothetical protein